MSKIAFIYPGQGAQKAGMGADFYENSEIARYIFDQAGEELDLDMKELCFEENDRLDLTEYTQAAMVTTCLAMTRVAESKGLKADITAGLSLGEYPAIAAAGGMNDMDAIRLVRKRGILMQNTVPAGEGAMCAVISMAAEEIEKVIEPIADVSVANYNCPGQIVITGKTDAVEEAAAKLKEAGARRTIMLNVSGPFHSQMLVPAGEKLAEELEHTRFHELRIPYVTNVTAEKVTDIRETPGLLTTQISSPVRWMQSMERMIADGVDTFVEIGPGKTLEGFLRKIDRSVKVFHISQWEDVDKVGEELADGGNRMEETEKHCCCCSDNVEGNAEGGTEKTTVRAEEQKKQLLNRLRRMEGQLRGIEAMLERDAYCNDILIQSAAVNAAVNSFNKELLANHIRTCVARDIRAGKDETIDELVCTLQKLMK